jgi:hypothetical protein
MQGCVQLPTNPLYRVATLCRVVEHHIRIIDTRPGFPAKSTPRNKKESPDPVSKRYAGDSTNIQKSMNQQKPQHQQSSGRD